MSYPFENLCPNPFDDLRNRWSYHSNGQVSRNPLGHSTYRNDYTVQPGPWMGLMDMGSEQMRLASFLPPGHNTHRPQAHSHLQKPEDWKPKLPLLYAPSRDRFPEACRGPHNRISNVNLNHGFGTYRSETQEQFDRPTEQAFDECVYELPSGYSTRNGDSLWKEMWVPTKPLCRYERERGKITTPPTRHNPWPSINLGHANFTENNYACDPIPEAIGMGCASYDPNTATFY